MVIPEDQNAYFFTACGPGLIFCKHLHLPQLQKKGIIKDNGEKSN
jgi:hypothetical protein